MASIDEPVPSLLSASPTPGERRLVLLMNICIFVAFGLVASFALTPLPRIDGYIPAVQSVIATTDLITAVLLFGQFTIVRSRALLVLASGYLFCAVVVVGHTLTFPGAFSPTGLLGAGEQTAAWLYVPWHLGLPVAALGYVWLARRPPASGTAQSSAAPAIAAAAAAAITLAVGFAWLAIAAADRLPRLVASETAFSPQTNLIVSTIFAVSVLALAALWRRRRTVLDEWLSVALCASVAETALITFIAASRYTVAFYFARPFAVVVSSAVLAALLWEIMRFYARLAHTTDALRREKANRLMNLDIVVGSVAHEVRQPLSVITTRAAIVQRLLSRQDTDFGRAQLSLDEIERAGRRAAETFDNIRALFRNPSEGQQPLDLGELVSASLRTLTGKLDEHRIDAQTEIATDLPPIKGHQGQLQQVLVNLMQNAVDAMEATTDRPRVLRLRVARHNGDRVLVTVEDSGQGIEPERLAGLFDALTSSKPGGTGLGLGLCRLLVEVHDGTIAVASEVGRGTRFEIELPSAFSDAARPARTAGQRRSLKSIPSIRGSA